LSFFVDANVPIYAVTGSGGYGDACANLLRAVAGGAEGRMSVAALEEVWHVELSGRAGAAGGMTERAFALFSPLLGVTEEVVRVALALDAPTLGANDRIHLATCLVNGIEVIVSADAGFDSSDEVRRVDPVDDRAVAELLGHG